MLQNAATREMRARGYVLAENPDLVINFHGRLEERVDIESRPAPSMGPTWGYRGWPSSTWGATEVTTRRTNVGTLVMDIVDREKRQAVFQGTLQTNVSSEMLRNREQTINTLVTEIFAKFPFVAGRSEQVAPGQIKN
jgi:hypothetical protein